MKQVDLAISRFYGKPVIAGYNNGGWPVVRLAADPDVIVAGGVGGTVPPIVEAVLEAQAALCAAVDELDTTGQ